MIAFTPDDLIPVPLACDPDTPQDKRPALLCRAMSVQERRAYHATLEEADTLALDEAVPAYGRALAMSVRAWRNVTGADGEGLPYALETLLDRMTPFRVRLLAHALPQALSLAEVDFFVSMSRPGSEPDPSVPAAAADAVPTGQPPTSPSSSPA